MEKHNKKKISKVEEIVDSSTGEIIDRKFTSLQVENEPSYVKMYLDDLTILFDIKNELISVLLKYMNWENRIILNSNERNIIAERLKIKKNTLDHHLTKCVDSGFLMKIATNSYLVNPNIFARGNWKDIQQLRTTMTYNKDGRLIKSEIQPYQTQIHYSTSVQNFNDKK